MESKLFTPIQLGKTVIKNRIVFPSICAHYCEKGVIGDRMWNYVKERAAGGCGLLIIPGSPHGKPSNGRPALSDDCYIPRWAEMAEMVHSYGAELFCQLHPASFQPGRGHKVSSPVEYSLELIDQIIDSYAKCAKRAQTAGLGGVEIHGAHAHEVAQFMSPFYNKREDEYGGSLENRAKFPMRIIKAIKAECGKDFPVIFRISGREMVAGGREIEDSVRLAMMMEEAGADAIHVSCGMPESEPYISAPMDVPDCFNVENAIKVKAKVHVPVITTNRVVTIEEAMSIVDNGYADMTSMARAQLADPNLVDKALGKNSDPVRVCVGCNQGCRTPNLYKSIRCLQNPRLGRESILNFEPAEEKWKDLKLMIVGAGPAGLELACDLALRGYRPEVFEASDKVGGLINLASKPPKKQTLERVITYRKAMAEKLGIPVTLNKKITVKDIEEYAPDVLFVATGSRPVVPHIPGLCGEKVFTGDEVLSGKEVPGKKIAVLGGGLVGCETAEYLAEQGKEVVIFEMAGTIAENLSLTRKWFMEGRMDEHHIERKLNTKIESISLPEITVSAGDEKETLSGFDAVVVAAGRAPVNSLAAEAAKAFKNLRIVTIGDAANSGLAIDAILNAAQTAAEF